MLALLLLAAGAVEGTVTNSATGAPIRKAQVALRATQQNTVYQAWTDAAGRFRIENAAPGEYWMWTGAQGYESMSHRATSPAQRVTVKDGETVRDLAIRLVPLGRITGKVVDEAGDPVAGVSVRAMRNRYVRGMKTLETRERVTTDERGEFRLFDLDPGVWYLRAVKNLPFPKVTGRVHSTVIEEDYVPASTGPIEVAPGAEVQEAGLRLRKVPVYHFRGRVMDARTGAGVGGARVHALDDGWSVQVKEDGSFDIRAMTPGTYRMAAELNRDGQMVSAAQTVVVSDRDVDGVVFRLEPLLTVRGTAREAAEGTRVVLEPVAGIGWMTTATVAADGSFTLAGVAPQQYTVQVDAGKPDAYVKSIEWGSQDVSDSGRIDVAGEGAALALVFGTDGGTVEGRVRSSAPAAAPLFVTLAPEGRYAVRFDLLRTVSADGGVFSITGVAPGDYKLFAWELADQAVAESPEFRALLESKAVRVTVRAGDRRAVQADVITDEEASAARMKLR